MKFKTAGFEGPLDLLLHLIKTMEIDIYDIPMQEITEQYLLYIHTMQELELDVASEYLVMAATLLAIKSKMLLPSYEESVDEEEYEEDIHEDPRRELVERLIEYRKYKEASLKLKEKEKERTLLFTKPPSDLSDFASGLPDAWGQKVTLYDMLGAYHKLMRRKKLQKPIRAKVTREEISLEERMDEICELLAGTDRPVSFFHLFPYPDKNNIVVSFLAILELMKRNEIVIYQERNFEEIWIRPAGREKEGGKFDDDK